MQRSAISRSFDGFVTHIPHPELSHYEFSEFGEIELAIAQYGSVKGYAVFKTINTGGFIMIPVPL
ncbi:hypothetical protein QUA38_23860, partial [Microcoleus sp. Pol12B4]